MVCNDYLKLLNIRSISPKGCFNPSEREIEYEMIRTGRQNYPAIILNETEMRMILDSLVEDGYVIGHKSDKPPYGLTYQYISGKK